MKKDKRCKAYYIGSKGTAQIWKIKGKFIAVIYYMADHTKDRILNWNVKLSSRVKQKQNAERYILRNLT